MKRSRRAAPAPAAVAYLRDGAPGLTLKQQEALLTRTGVSLDGAYRDTLNPTQLRRREARSLKQRARLLGAESRLHQPGTAPMVIHVAALRCLGWSVADVARTLAAIGCRGASLHLADTGQVFTPAQLNAGVLLALAGVDETWRRGQTEEGRSAAAAVVADKAEEARRAKIETARPLWAKPSAEVSAAEIAQAVGLSLGSLTRWLGPRRTAQARAKGLTRAKAG